MTDSHKPTSKPIRRRNSIEACLVHLFAGRALQAIHFFDKAVAAGADPQTICRYQARAHMLLGNRNAAVSVLSSALASGHAAKPELHAQILFERAILGAAHGEMVAARADLAAAVALAPVRETPVTRLLSVPGKWEVQAGLDAVGVGRSSATTEGLDSVLRKAKSYYNASYYAKAIPLYEVVLERIPTLDSAWYELGWSTSETHDYTRAVAALSRAAWLRPWDSYVFNNLGVALSRLGRKDEAIVSYSEAIRLEPENRRPRLGRAAVFNELGRYAEAIADYDYDIEIDPMSPAVRVARGVCHMELHRRHLATSRCMQAHDDFSRAILQDPRFALPYYHRARCLQGEPESWAAVLSDLNTAIELNPNWPDAYRLRGVAHKNLGMLHAAMRDFDLGIDNPRDETQAHMVQVRADVHYALGMFAAAEQDYSLAMDVLGATTDRLRVRAQARMRLGAFEAAIADFDSAVALTSELARELPGDAKCVPARSSRDPIVGSLSANTEAHKNASCRDTPSVDPKRKSDDDDLESFILS